MGLARNLFLWSSRSEVLRRFLPGFGFMRRAVARFMPGEHIEDALRAAEMLRISGIASVVTFLGENIVHEGEARSVALHYLDVLEGIHRQDLDCHISVKLTQLGLDLNQDLCVLNLSTIIQRAHELGNVVWIDMESSAYVDRTLKLFRKMRQIHSNVGVCLQSYLLRTADDLDDLLPLLPLVRLVKGAYAEPKGVAFRSKRDVDKNFFDQAMRLLQMPQQDTKLVGIATHDMPLIEQIIRSASQQGAAKDMFEIQMLYGIQREQQLRLTKEGFRVRVLISYGSFWFPWYMRRLAERPANVLFVVKSMLRN